jgi:hypothetical protein
VRHSAPQKDLDDRLDLALILSLGLGCRVAGGLLIGGCLLGRLFGIGRNGAGVQTAGRDHPRRAQRTALHGLPPGQMRLVVSIVVCIHDSRSPLNSTLIMLLGIEHFTSCFTAVVTINAAVETRGY